MKQKIFCLLIFFLVFSISFFFNKPINAQTISTETETVEINAKVAGSAEITFTVIPEQRVQINPPFNNLSTDAYIEIRNVGSFVPLDTYGPFTTTNNGHFNTPYLLSSTLPGLYDVVIKGYSHLKKKVSYFLVSSPPVNALDFGTILCGDVYTNATYPNGDNYVDSSDINYLISQWGQFDAGISDNRADVDEDQYIDSSDYTKTYTHYGQLGD